MFYGSVFVPLHDAPQTSALARLGSLVSKQFVFGLFFAAGSRNLNRKSVSDAVGGFCVVVAVNTAPLLASSWWPLPPQSPTGAWIEPCQLSTLFASPVGSQSVAFELAGIWYVMASGGVVVNATGGF